MLHSLFPSRCLPEEIAEARFSVYNMTPKEFFKQKLSDAVLAHDTEQIEAILVKANEV